MACLHRRRRDRWRNGQLKDKMDVPRHSIQKAHQFRPNRKWATFSAQISEFLESGIEFAEGESKAKKNKGDYADVFMLMSFSSSPTSKRSRLINSDSMDAETAKVKLLAAKEQYGREVRVFETYGTSQSPTETTDTEESDDFYEFKPEDYYRMLATKKDDKYLKTRKIRDAEVAARRSRYTKAVIRVRFPDNHTLEATFHPSETIQNLVDLLKKVVASPELPFYLYTTPPKMQIKDVTQDFFSAGFVPGAIVYFSYDVPKDEEAHSGPFLGEEIMLLKGLDFVPEPVNPEPESESINPVTPTVEHRKPTEKKAVKPKWMKM